MSTNTEVINQIVEPFVKSQWDKNLPAAAGGIDNGVVITTLVNGKLIRIRVDILNGNEDI